MELSVVVLSYQSQRYVDTFVRQVHTEVTELHISFEIVVVANYDSKVDLTATVARSLASELTNIIVVSKPKKGRMGWDMRSGLEAAQGDYIAIIDGDGQIPVSDIGTVYALIKSGKYDLVKTYRQKRFDGFSRIVMSHTYNWLFKALFKPKIPMDDINAKPKIITRTAYEKMVLISNDWFTDAEIMIQANKLNLRCCQVATVFHKNERRSSFVNWRTAAEFLYNLLKFRFHYSEGDRG
jgi:glycosyltransferase involved in cell wall biosynthesis